MPANSTPGRAAHTFIASVVIVAELAGAGKARGEGGRRDGRRTEGGGRKVLGCELLVMLRTFEEFARRLTTSLQGWTCRNATVSTIHN